MNAKTSSAKAQMFDRLLLDALTPERLGELIRYLHGSSDLSIEDIFAGDAALLGELITGSEVDLRVLIKPIMAEALSDAISAKVTIAW